MRSERPPLGGKVAFIQDAKPGLLSGEYEALVEQKVAGAGFGESFRKTARFSVRGPRFALDPAGLHSVFPPEESEGAYVRTLPHAVLRRASLPWERAVGGDAPWLAVLLLDSEDAKTRGFELAPRPAKVRDLFQPALGAGVSGFSRSKPGDALGTGESEDDDCQTIDVPPALFRAIAPSREDLKVLAHVRRADLGDQDRDPDTDDGSGCFSVVIGNRLPRAERRSRAYLVSLEGLDDELPAEGKTFPDAPAGSFIRLPVLKSWSFSAVELKEGTGFVDLLSTVEPGVLQPRPPRAPGEKDSAAAAALAMGYSALSHEMRAGDRSVAWYRGPFIPYAKSRRVVKTPVSSADAAARFDPDSGMFDLSYAAAWQLGRLLALQDKAYTTMLYDWKRALERDLLDEATRETSLLTLSSVLPANAPGRDLRTAFLDVLGSKLARAAAERP